MEKEFIGKGHCVDSDKINCSLIQKYIVTVLVIVQ